MSEIEINNVGPIRNFRFATPDGGGVIVLRGRNGAGKSHVLDAVQSLVSGNGSPPIRDGEEKASVSGIGATLKVGRRTTRQGEVEVETLDDGASPAALVDPGIQDPDRADAARIKALLRLSGATVEPERFTGFVDGIRIAIPSGETDPVKLAAIAARGYQAAAREQEEEARRFESAAKAPLPEATDPGRVDPEEVAIAVKNKVEIEARAKAFEAAAKASEASRKRLGDLMDGLESRLETAIAERQGCLLRYDESVRAADETRDQIADLQRKLESLNANCRLRHAELTSATNVVARVDADRDECSRLQREIERADAVGAVKPEEIEAAAKAVEEATRRRDQMVLWMNRLAAEQRRSSAKIEMAARVTMAEACRAAAVKCEGVLSELVQSLGLPLSVVGGRLRIATDRSDTELFSDLSHGERWRAAIDVCVQSFGERAVLVIPQEAWEGIDPPGRQAIGEHARAKHCTIITAECADSTLTAVAI